MVLDDFDFDLPPELIAQRPAERRDASRLMTLDRQTGVAAERPFAALPELLREGDLLVLNDTRVIPARLRGHKESGGKVEIFLVRPSADGTWSALLRSSKPPRAGMIVHLPGGAEATVIGAEGEGWRISIRVEGDFGPWLELHGEVPLPPYIRRPFDAGDRERYQTVFAANPGAVAAPTAGLHFTEPILESIRSRGVTIAPLTLHVGIGTFSPIRSNDFRDHRIHRERYCVPPETAAQVEGARNGGGRVVALGTTAARALEHAASAGRVNAGEAEADLFIYPGYRFRVVDALITNFHLPRSSLLLFVCAFGGTDPVLAAYRQAVARRFRFFSYGDCMFIS